jgi:hypothetical protein
MYYLRHKTMQRAFRDSCNEFTGAALEAPLDGLSMVIGRVYN